MPVARGGVTEAERVVTYGAAANAVPANVETNVLVVTVPMGHTLICLAGSAIGMTDAIFRFYKQATELERRANAWTSRNVDFISQIVIAEGETVKITAQHRSANVHDFSATLTGLYY